MRKFVGHLVEVETAGQPPEPVTVIWKERRWEILRVEQTWFDTGHGSLPVTARTWRTRRHRKVYRVLAKDGAYLTLYLDYARPDQKTWHLISIEEPES